jgi:DNA-binding MarR family transcriptional regulator
MDTDRRIQEAARAVLEIIPPTMRTVGTEMRRVGHDLFPGHMRLLGMCANRVWTLRELAEAQGVRPPTMSRTVNALVERGWLTRTPSEQDRREVQISLTAHGQEVFEEVGRKVQAHIATLLAPLTAVELETMLAGLAVLHKAFEAAFQSEEDMA